MKALYKIFMPFVFLTLMSGPGLKAQVEDLYLSNPWISTTVASQGDTVNFGCESHYLGNNAVGFTTNVAVYASNDENFNPMYDEYIMQFQVWHSITDTLQQVSFVVPVPLQADPGVIHLIFVTDYQNWYPETNESNNTTAISLTICPIAAELPYTCDFETSSWPICWFQQTSATDGGWLLGDSASLGSTYFAIPAHGNFVATNDDDCNCNKYTDALVSPNFDISGQSSFMVGFDYFFQGLTYGTGTEYLYLVISYDDGLSWNYHASITGSSAWSNYLYEFQNNTQTQIRFAIVYTDMNEWMYGAAIDNFFVAAAGSMFQLNVSPYTCMMGSLAVTNLTGTPPYTFQWSTGATSQSISNLFPGYYSVTVTDALNNVEVKNAYIEDWSMQMNANINHSTGSDGAIVLNVNGGVNPYWYNWSNGATSSAIYNLSPGVYSVTATDMNGCTVTGTYEVFQQGNYALNFDGYDDKLIAYNFYNQTLSDSLTIAMWINPNAWGNVPASGYGTIFSKGGILCYLHNNGYPLYQMNSLVITMPMPNGTSVYANSPAFSVSLNNWQHLAFTYESGVAKLYINGIELPLTYLNNVTPYGPMADNYYSNLVIGGRDSNIRPFAGKIDEVKLWKRALSQTEISAQFCGVTSNNQLLAYWPLNNGPYGYEAQDASGNWNYAYLNNFNMGDSTSGWVLSDCPSIPNFDLGIVSVLNPKSNYPALFSLTNEKVSVVLKNFGTTTINSVVPVWYTVNGIDTVTEYATVNLPPLSGMIYQFTTALDTFVAGYYMLNASVNFTDNVANNNSITMQYNVNPVSRPALSRRSNRFVLFDLNAPWLDYEFGPALSGDFMTAGSYANNQWYASTNASNLLLQVQYYSGIIDTIGTLMPATGALSTSISGLAYDYSSSTMYAIDYQGNLWTVNLSTAALTYVGYTGVYNPVNLACSLMGDLYTVSIDNDYLYRINKNNASATQVGWIGFDVDYAQDMEYDHNTETLYMVAFNVSSSTAELRTVDTYSGYSYYQSLMARNGSYTGFAVPFQFNNVFDYQVTPYTCNYGSIQLLNFQGTPPFTIQWSTGDTTQLLSNLYSGGYSVTVTDAAGLSETASIYVENYSMYQNAMVTNSQNGLSNGSIEVMVQGGYQPLTYTWSNGQQTPYIDSLANGWYSLTVTDAMGCQIFGSWEIITQLPYALSFDGLDDYASVWSYGQLNLTDSFTVSMWINPAGWGTYSTTGYGNFFAKGDYYMYLHNFGYPGYAVQSLVIRIPLADGNFATANTPAYSISLNQWQNISMSYQSGQVKVYINFVEVPLNYLNGFYPYGSMQDNYYRSLYLGNRESMQRPFAGKIDELKIWQDVLSLNQLIGQSCGANIYPGLVAYWPLNDGPSSYSFVDVSGNYLTGWLNNMYLNDPSSGWINQDCPVLPAFDLNPAGLLNPDNELANLIQSVPLPVSVVVKNSGTQTSFQPFTVSYQLDNNPVVTETSWASILPMQTTTHTFAVNLPVLAIGMHQLKVIVSYPMDMNMANDTLVRTINMNYINTPAFAERDNQMVLFDLNNPSIDYPFAQYLPGENLSGGAMVNGQWYCVTLNSSALIKVDLYTGNTQTIGYFTYPNISGLSFDYMTNTMFAIDFSGNLYTVNMTNAVLTLIGSTGISSAINLACSLSGQLYSLSIMDDYLYSINKTTAQATAIGWIGFDALYNQDMEFNLNTGDLYMVTYNEGALRSELRWVDVASGYSYFVNTLEIGTSYAGFAIYYNGSSAVQANFTSDVNQGLNPLTVNFSDLSSGSPVNWFWDFGDGYISYQQNPVHTYQTPGFFTVKLIAGNATSVDTMIAVNYILVNPNQQGPANWYYSNTGSNHTILIPQYANLQVNGQPIGYGDYLGVFYDSLGTPACGGFVQWQGSLTALTAWGAQAGMHDGFASGETFTWKVFDISEGVELPATVVYDALNFPNTGTFAENGLSGIESLSTPSSNPGWNYTVTGTSHSILILGLTPITIDGVQIQPGDYLGVFFSNGGNLQCGGYVQWTGNNTAMTVWGDDAQTADKDGFEAGETFQWIIWRLNENQTYEATASYIQPPAMPNTGSFAANGISGIMQLVVLTIEYQYIAMPQGWSVFSTYMDAMTPNIDSLCHPFVSQVIIAKDALGHSYWPQYGINLIGNVEIGKGYQIKLASPQEMAVAGQAVVPENTPVTINQGWSFIGYLRKSPAPINLMLAPVVSEIIIVKSGSGMTYWPAYNINMIGNMLPGAGYQIKMNSTQVLTYPSNNQTYTKNDVQTLKPVHFGLDANTGNSMTIGIPRGVWALQPVFGDEIGIYNTAGQLVGSSVYSDENTAVTVWGKDETDANSVGLQSGEAFEIRHWSAATNSESRVLVSGWQLGSGNYEKDGIAIPELLIQSSGLNFALFGNQPNPFKNETTIGFSIPVNTQVRLSVYSLLGQELEVLLDEEMPQGLHQYKLDAGQLPAGTYYYRLETPQFQSSRKMIIAE